LLFAYLLNFSFISSCGLYVTDNDAVVCKHEANRIKDKILQ